MKPLAVKLLDIPMQGGLAEHVDARVLPPQGAFLTLSNVVYDKGGAVRLRAGFGQLPDAISGAPLGVVGASSTLPAASNLYDSNGALLAVARPPVSTDLASLGCGFGCQLYGYSPERTTWHNADDVPRCAVSRTTVVRSAFSALSPRVVVYNGLAWYFWLSDAGPVRARVVSLKTGNVVVPDHSVSGAPIGGLPAQYDVCLSGTKIFLVFQEGDAVTLTNPMVLVVFDATAPFSPSTSYTVYTDLPKDGPLVVQPYTNGGVEYFIVGKAGMTTSLNLINASGTVLAGALLDSSTYIVEPPNVVNLDFVVRGSSVHVVYMGQDTTTLSKYLLYWRLNVQHTSFWNFVPAFYATPVRHPTLATSVYGGSQGKATVGVRANGNAVAVLVDGDLLRLSEFTPTGTLLEDAIASTVTRWAYPMSRPFLHGGVLYMVVGTPAFFEAPNNHYPPTVLLVSLDSDWETSPLLGTTNAPKPAKICAILARQRGSYNAINRVLDPAVVDGTTLLVPVGVLGAGTTPFDTQNEGIDAYLLDFSDTAQAYQASTEASNLLLSAGGFLAQFDGDTWHENGFVHSPDVEDNTFTTVGSIPKGVYGYAFVYEWHDAAGNLHQSAPAFWTLDSTGSPNANNKHRLTVRLLSLTHRGWYEQGQGRPVVVAMYRTLKDSTGPYYRITRPLNAETPAATPTQWLVASEPSGVFYLGTDGRSGVLEDNTTDALLLSHGYGTLYTEGGVLESVQPPAASCVLAHKGRAWLASAEDDRELWYSKPLAAGHPPEFSDALTLRLDESPDGITALASLDDKLVVFTTSRIYIVQGDGPSATGQGGSFLAPQLVASEAGCVDPRSVISSDAGVFFRSARGIAVLTRSLEVQYVGQYVQDEVTSASVINSVVLDAARRRITWCLADRVLVYDYEHQAWLTWSLTGDDGAQPLSSHALSGGLVVAATPDLGVHLEAHGPDPGRDEAGGFDGVVETPWLHLAGMSGFQRARRFYLLARDLGAHAILVQAYNDYSDSPSQTHTFLVDGSDDPVGLPVERLMMHVAQQKCSAIKFRVTMRPADTEALPPGVSLAGMSLEIGLESGGARLPAPNRKNSGDV